MAAALSRRLGKRSLLGARVAAPDGIVPEPSRIPGFSPHHGQDGAPRSPNPGSPNPEFPNPGSLHGQQVLLTPLDEQIPGFPPCWRGQDQLQALPHPGIPQRSVSSSIDVPKRRSLEPVDMDEMVAALVLTSLSCSPALTPWQAAGDPWRDGGDVSDSGSSTTSGHWSSVTSSPPHGSATMSPPHCAGSVTSSPPHGSATMSPPHCAGSVTSSPPHGGVTMSPPHCAGSVTLSPPHGGVTLSPPHGGVTASPPHCAGSVTSSPPHGGVTMSPPHGSVTMSPLHGSATTSPPHCAGSATMSPSHGSVTMSPSHSSATMSPSHGGATMSPSHSSATMSPPHSTATMSLPCGTATVSPSHGSATMSPPCGSATTSPPHGTATVSPSHHTGSVPLSPPRVTATVSPSRHAGGVPLSPPRGAVTSSPPADDGFDTDPEPSPPEEPARRRRKALVMFKCLWPGCGKVLRSGVGIKRHVRTRHLGDGSEREEDFYYTELQVAPEPPTELPPPAVTSVTAVTGVNAVPSVPVVTAVTSATPCSAPIVIPGQPGLSHSAPPGSFWHIQADHAYQALPSIQIPVSPHIFTSISWAAATSTLPSLSPVRSRSLSLSEPRTPPLLQPQLLMASPPRVSLVSRKIRGEAKKCRKVYGIENRDQWCTACRWKKACQRFLD